MTESIINYFCSSLPKSSSGMSATNILKLYACFYASKARLCHCSSMHCGKASFTERKTTAVTKGLFNFLHTFSLFVYFSFPQLHSSPASYVDALCWFKSTLYPPKWIPVTAPTFRPKGACLISPVTSLKACNLFELLFARYHSPYISFMLLLFPSISPFLPLYFLLPTLLAAPFPLAHSGTFINLKVHETDVTACHEKQGKKPGLNTVSNISQEITKGEYQKEICTPCNHDC